MQSNSLKHNSHYVFRPNLHLKKNLLDIVRNKKIDIIVSFSDSWIGILAASIAKEAKCKLLIDAYDNYESYTPYFKPLHYAWRKACHQADYLTASSTPLLNLLLKNSSFTGLSKVIPMAADPNFVPLDLKKCRHHFNIDPSIKIIGHFGSIDKHRNQPFLLKLADHIIDRNDIQIFISGRKLDRQLTTHAKITNLGYIASEKIPQLINACNIVLCLNKEDSFGSYASPVKIYEALSCNRRILCSRTKSIEWILNDQQSLLLDLNDDKNANQKIIDSLENHYSYTCKTQTWRDIAQSFYILISSKHLE
ncbi:glycosyltransferase [Chitinibacter sp. SCUT-21]|uniref:glycosyltransferase n=1 Tax=Chitinibacter sp. SCUT-21 TaxID=2970891 RepID=UPI0035A5FE73